MSLSKCCLSSFTFLCFSWHPLLSSPRSGVPPVYTWTAMHWCILCHPLKSGFVRRRLLCSLTCCRSQTFLLTQLPPFFSKLFIFPLKAISILVEASQRIFQTLLLNQHKSVAFGYFLLIFSLHFHDLCAPHPRLCILAVIPPTSVTTISISWAAVSELQGPTFPFLLECEDLQEAQLVPFLPPPLFCAKLFLLKSSIFPCPISKSVSMFLILEATHLLSKVRFYTPPAKKKKCCSHFSLKVNHCWAIKHTSHWFSVLSHIWTHVDKPGEETLVTLHSAAL